MPCLLALILSPNPQPLATTNLLSFSTELDVRVCDCVCAHMCVCVCVCTLSCSIVSNCLGPLGLAPLSTGFSGKDTGARCHGLLQGIFPTQGLNPHLLCLLIGRGILYRWAPGNPYTAERHLRVLMLIMLPPVSTEPDSVLSFLPAVFSSTFTHIFFLSHPLELNSSRTFSEKSFPDLRSKSYYYQIFIAPWVTPS